MRVWQFAGGAVLLLGAFLVWRGESAMRRRLVPKFAGDYVIYRDAASRAEQGEDPYRDTEGHVNVGATYLYPPFCLAVVGLFSRLADPWDQAAWVGVNTAAVLASFILTAFFLRPQSSPRRRFVIGLAGFGWLVFGPFIHMVETGQINGLVLLSILLFFHVLERRGPLAAAPFLAFAGLMKGGPFFLAVVFLGRGRRGIAGLAFTAVLVFLFSLLGSGREFWTLHRQFMLAAAEVGSSGILAANNASLAALGVRLLGDGGRGVSPAQGKIIVYAVVFACALLGILASGCRERNPGIRLYLPSIGLVLMLLVSPVVWYHHGVFLLPAMTQVLMDQRLPKAWRGFLLAAAYLPIQAFPYLFYSGWAQGIWPFLMGVLAFSGALLWALSVSSPGGRTPGGRGRDAVSS